MAAGLVFLGAAYITISTLLINKPPYLKHAWDEVRHSPHIENWQEGEVTAASLQEERFKQLFLAKPTAWATINRHLLRLNGNHAIRVMFHTDNEGILGPITVYFNPFTKQVIGFDVLE
ncbi:hypothetical protein MJA45_02500 [Paenibacillus aurantius]|uniref:Uncharacterized protein n=1 Tax=Paenibacillus aurantius TaxID=2918900 RepID=A0AA96LDE8_9BACL|nr:hypothetical protein [Paenibacillus aurantius]WNQ11949.1 hypothetical protein MJA45_02500 [Paenibacillus aurantius]